MIKKLSRSNRQKWLDIDRTKAMPKVKTLVKKHGRTIVVWCINQLREYEKKVRAQNKIVKKHLSKSFKKRKKPKNGSTNCGKASKA
jgi:hypothetical protein